MKRIFQITMFCFISTIINGQSPYPLYEIGDINNNNNSGFPDSMGVACEIRGIVYGVNLRASGLQFTIIDPSDKEEGVGVFRANGDLGYTVTEGDEVGIFGSVDFFNGFTQMEVDSVSVISTSNTLHDPDPITQLNETTESKLVKVFNLTLNNPSQWTNSGNGFNVDARDDNNINYQIRIDNDTEIYGTPPPTEPFNVTGLGGQFDSNSPYNSGYQILPRYLPDFEMWVEPVATDNPQLENKVHIFPNPTSDVLLVGSEVLLDKIFVTNILGKQISEIAKPAHNESIQVSNYATGVYLITFEKDGYRWTRQWMKK